MQRYELAHAGRLVGLRTADDGRYVLYTDHRAEIAAIGDIWRQYKSKERIKKLEASNRKLREAVEQLADDKGDAYWTKEEVIKIAKAALG